MTYSDYRLLHQRPPLVIAICTLAALCGCVKVGRGGKGGSARDAVSSAMLGVSTCTIAGPILFRARR